MPGRSMDLKAWGLLFTLALLWASSFLFVEIALSALGPFSVVLARVGLAALLVYAALRLCGQAMPLSPGLWGAFFVMGALNNAIPFGLIAWAQVEIESGLAAILNATTPLFTVLLAHVLTRDERLSPAKAAGVLCGLAGVVLVIGPGALAGLGAASLAQVAVLGAAMSYGLAGIFGRRLAGLPPAVAACGMLTASTVLIAPAALYLEQPWSASLDWQIGAALLALAGFSTALAYLVYFRLLRAAGATNLLLVTFLLPPGAVVLGALVLDERLPTEAFAGMAVILLALLLVDGRCVAWLRALGRAKAVPAAAASAYDGKGQ